MLQHIVFFFLCKSHPMYKITTVLSFSFWFICTHSQNQLLFLWSHEKILIYIYLIDYIADDAFIWQVFRVCQEEWVFPAHPGLLVAQVRQDSEVIPVLRDLMAYLAIRDFLALQEREDQLVLKASVVCYFQLPQRVTVFITDIPWYIFNLYIYGLYHYHALHVVITLVQV